MKEKIKNLFAFMGRAWTGGSRGKFGVIILVVATFIFVRMFFGENNIQHFLINIWHLNRAQEQLIVERQNLNTLEQHIKLLQNNSPDYIEELGLQRLNIGHPDSKILRF